MSHSDEDYDHPIAQHDPKEGFDDTEPNTPAIWLFTIGSIIGLVLVIVAVEGYFNQIYKDAVTERVLTVPSELLQDVRNRDAWNLSHYMYGDLDKSSNRVRMPIDKAMQTFAVEAAAGKLFYPAKATAIKKEEPDAAAAAPAGTTAPGAPAAPAAATPAPTPTPAKK